MSSFTCEALLDLLRRSQPKLKTRVKKLIRIYYEFPTSYFGKLKAVEALRCESRATRRFFFPSDTILKAFCEPERSVKKKVKSESSLKSFLVVNFRKRKETSIKHNNDEL